MIANNRLLEKMFMNPYEQPILKGRFNVAHPLQIWSKNNDVDVPQFFMKVNNENEPAMDLADIQEHQARISTELERRQKLKGDINQEAETIEQFDLIDQKEDALTSKYLEFKNKVDNIKFLTKEQKAVMEEKFISQLYDNNKTLFDVYDTPQLIRNGEMVDDLQGGLRQQLTVPTNTEMKPGAIEPDYLGTGEDTRDTIFTQVTQGTQQTEPRNDIPVGGRADGRAEAIDEKQNPPRKQKTPQRRIPKEQKTPASSSPKKKRQSTRQQPRK